MKLEQEIAQLEKCNQAYKFALKLKNKGLESEKANIAFTSLFHLVLLNFSEISNIEDLRKILHKKRVILNQRKKEEKRIFVDVSKIVHDAFLQKAKSEKLTMKQKLLNFINS